MRVRWVLKTLLKAQVVLILAGALWTYVHRPDEANHLDHEHGSTLTEASHNETKEEVVGDAEAVRLITQDSPINLVNILNGNDPEILDFGQEASSQNAEESLVGPLEPKHIQEDGEVHDLNAQRQENPVTNDSKKNSADNLESTLSPDGGNQNVNGIATEPHVDPAEQEEIEEEHQVIQPSENVTLHNELEHPKVQLKMQEIPPRVTGKFTEPPLNQHFKEYKKILYQNRVYRRTDFLIGEGVMPFQSAECSHTQCFATADRDMFRPHEWDAVIFNIGDDDQELPEYRYPDVIYIGFGVEGPLYRHASFDYHKFKGVFNWTFTYRRDSDLWNPYGSYLPREEVLPRSYKNYAKGKTKLAAWMSSHCDTMSEREVMVEELIKYMPIDKYGHCHDLKCPREQLWECCKMVESTYKFYLSFENSVCLDYVTEKVFRWSDYDVVPVVYGFGHENMGIPSDAYINLLNFESLEDLAGYLKYLDSNDTAYNEYFRYRERVQRKYMNNYLHENYCEICKRLHTMYPILEDGTKTIAPVTDETRHYYKVYEDFHDWWVTKSKCLQPQKNSQFYNFIRGMSKTDIRNSDLEGEDGIDLTILDFPNFEWPRNSSLSDPDS